MEVNLVEFELDCVFSVVFIDFVCYIAADSATCCLKNAVSVTRLNCRSYFSTVLILRPHVAKCLAKIFLLYFTCRNVKKSCRNV